MPEGVPARPAIVAAAPTWQEAAVTVVPAAAVSAGAVSQPKRPSAVSNNPLPNPHFVNRRRSECLARKNSTRAHNSLQSIMSAISANDNCS